MRIETTFVPAGESCRLILLSKGLTPIIGIERLTDGAFEAKDHKEYTENGEFLQEFIRINATLYCNVAFSVSPEWWSDFSGLMKLIKSAKLRWKKVTVEFAFDAGGNNHMHVIDMPTRDNKFSLLLSVDAMITAFVKDIEFVSNPDEAIRQAEELLAPSMTAFEDIICEPDNPFTLSHRPAHSEVVFLDDPTRALQDIAPLESPPMTYHADTFVEDVPMETPQSIVNRASRRATMFGE